MSLSSEALPLFRELGDLKRIHSADRSGSIAERLFVSVWSGLVSGMAAEEVCNRVTAAALAAARLGDLDLRKLRQLGLEEPEAVAVLEKSFDEIAGPIDDGLAAELREHLARGAPTIGNVPPFVDALVRQPRAGVTCPGKPRIMLAPTENHAEHSLVVAVYGVIAAGWEDADHVPVFLAGMAHHLHSAAMPDSGYSGEILLGDALDRVIEHSREMAFAQLGDGLQGQMREAIEPIGGSETAEAHAFHVGDVIDRVLEIEQHVISAQVTMDTVIEEYGLVHDGPVKPLHDEILTQAGLA
ncbi:hypothetical protein GRI38_10920 [Altererythrobacter aurantiacus]|uniref:HD domain-containing protein n=1 Tax=Parapontixanthobacter aurantiacus TaxID=1463599 RepID=A0A844ZF90_9SPHN|nr:hypothetical protein [Parapontixanthobacter aurantiacus]MXO86535.1 hypothetical protein [Parapontixanthobacter aurantiacus]